MQIFSRTKSRIRQEPSVYLLENCHWTISCKKVPLCTFAFWTHGSSGHFELVIYGYFFINLFTAYNSGTVKKFMNVYETPPFVTIWPWTMNQKWLRLTVRYYWHLLCALLNDIRFFFLKWASKLMIIRVHIYSWI